MQQRGQILTDKIIDTADKLFYNQGYNSTGINQVIEEASIAKGSLYKHFDSKTDLMIAYLERHQEELLKRLEVATGKEPDPKAKLLALFDYHSERQNLRNFGGCALVKANDEAGQNDPRILAEIQKAKQRVKAFIKNLVERSGHKKILTDHELTESIFFMIEGSVVAASIFKNDSEIQTAKSIIKKLL
jgi:AcrR family transcriptional regulator